jgi:hypothetical protein
MKAFSLMVVSSRHKWMVGDPPVKCGMVRLTRNDPQGGWFLANIREWFRMSFSENEISRIGGIELSEQVAMVGGEEQKQERSL